MKNIKSLVGLNKTNDSLDTLVQNTCNCDKYALSEQINHHFQNVSSHILPLEYKTPSEIFNIPDKYIIPISSVEQQLRKLNIHKSEGPDGIPGWLLKIHPKI